jgi:hypothetical protein
MSWMWQSTSIHGSGKLSLMIPPICCLPKESQELNLRHYSKGRCYYLQTNGLCDLGIGSGPYPEDCCALNCAELRTLIQDKNGTGII